MWRDVKLDKRMEWARGEKAEHLVFDQIQGVFDFFVGPDEYPDKYVRLEKLR